MKKSKVTDLKPGDVFVYYKRRDARQIKVKEWHRLDEQHHKHYPDITDPILIVGHRNESGECWQSVNSPDQTIYILEVDLENRNI